MLHVANGTSVTDTLALTGIPGRRSIWADPLYDGPVPAGLTDEELVDQDSLPSRCDGVRRTFG